MRSDGVVLRGSGDPSALDVFVAGRLAGSLFKPESEPDKHHFAYAPDCPPPLAVSLSMPVVREHYPSAYKALHPVFDMNLPEGALAERLRKEFSKVVPRFDSLALLRIVGGSQIGRLQFAAPGNSVADVPAENLGELLAHDGAQGLFESLLNRYAVYSGVSGAMPKVLVRDNTYTPRSVTHRGATHLVKAWGDEYPQLAENEFFCMRAAQHAKLPVPTLQLSQGGKFLVVARFDLTDRGYRGFEDFCVLNGKTAAQKYEGSYENVCRRIKDFVSPAQVRPALEQFFKALALSCAVKNGDAHLKNFGVVYDDAESTVQLAPIYDVVTTTVYQGADVLALTLGGTKRWPKTAALAAFARAHCDLTEARTRLLLGEVAQGMHQASAELAEYLQDHAAFAAVGTAMLRQWRDGMDLSLLPPDEVF